MLIPRFPGSKRKLLRSIDDGGQYDAVVEPFTGAGHTTLHLLPRVNHAFIADADPSVWSIWHCWSHPETHPLVYGHLRELQLDAVENVTAAWPRLKAEFEAADTSDPPRLAAVSLTLRKLTFGGVIRYGAGGRLNITWNQCQIDILKYWRYQFPLFPPGAYLSLSHSWGAAVDAFEASSSKAAIALVDPPYWLPYTPGTTRRGTGGMTPAYPGHEPHAVETLELCVDCVRRLANSPKVKRLVVANYWSQPLHDELMDIAKSAGHPVSWVNKGRLDGINRSRAVATQNLDTLWAIGSTHQKQLSLFVA